jgi:hypothetical protein
MVRSFCGALLASLMIAASLIPTAPVDAHGAPSQGVLQTPGTDCVSPQNPTTDAPATQSATQPLNIGPNGNATIPGPRPCPRPPVPTSTPPPAQLQAISPGSWQDLISFRPSLPVQDAIAQRWSIEFVGSPRIVAVLPQRVEDGINDITLDTYELNITRLPNNPATGMQFTGDALFEHVRLNLNTFVDPNYAVFTPYSSVYWMNPLNGNDEALWRSANPEGALLSILVSGIPRKTLSVFTAKYQRTATDSYWIFNTANTPGDWQHPLSGARQFGLQQTSNGWRFYTRAMDRMAGFLWESQRTMIENGQRNTWTSLQTKLAAWINANGGSATILAPTIQRVNWPQACPNWQPSILWRNQAVLRDAKKCDGTITTFIPIGRRSDFTTGIQVFNIANESAPVSVVYVSGHVLHYAFMTIPANNSITLINGVPPGSTPPPVGFENAAIYLESRQPLRVVTNYVRNSTKVFESSTAFISGAPQINLPLLHRNNYGFSSWVAVQNIETYDVNVILRYFTPAGGVINEGPIQLPPGASWVFNQASNSALPVVSAGRIDADGRVVATVMQESASSLLAYNGLVNGEAATQIAAPLVMANNYGYNSGIQVQNAGSDATVVTVAYTNNIAVASPNPNAQPVCVDPTPGADGFFTTTQVVQAKASVTFSQSTTADPRFANCRYVGAATITSAQPIVAVVNQLNSTPGAVAASSYTALNPIFAPATVFVPLTQANHFRTSSGVQIQNMGVNATNVTITYGSNTASDVQNRDGLRPCQYLPAQRTISIAAGQSQTISQQSEAAFQGCMYVGSMRVQAPTGARLGVVVNQINTDYTDRLATYVAQ